MSLEFVSLGPDDYDRAKKIFNAAKHPAFIGRELVFRCARNGQAVVAVLDGEDVGVALVVKGKLQAMSVAKSAQGVGVGGKLLAHVRPRFASVIAERVAWFEKRGYKSVGAANVGQNGKHVTQLMEFDDSFVSPEAVPSESPPSPADPAKASTITPRPPNLPKEEEPTLSLFSFVPANQTLPPNIEREIEVLDDLYAKALRSEKFDSALKITERAHVLIARFR